MSYYSVSPTHIPFPQKFVGTGKVYRSPMPRSDELRRFKEETKINKIIQLCFDREFGFYGKGDVPRKYKEMDFEVIKFPIEDFKVPESKEETMKIVDRILEALKQGENILIHCVGGNGRTGLLLACLARKVFGHDGPTAIDWVRQYVHHAVERQVQEQFVATFLEDSEVVSESPLSITLPPMKKTEQKSALPQQKHTMGSGTPLRRDDVIIEMDDRWQTGSAILYNRFDDEDGNQGCFSWLKKYCCC